jgi:hypothetical protein
MILEILLGVEMGLLVSSLLPGCGPRRDDDVN